MRRHRNAGQVRRPKNPDFARHSTKIDGIDQQYCVRTFANHLLEMIFGRHPAVDTGDIKSVCQPLNKNGANTVVPFHSVTDAEQHNPARKGGLKIIYKGVHLKTTR